MRICNKKFKLGVWLAATGFFLLLLSSSARALLEVTYNESLVIDRIQYYWAGDSMTAASTSRIINPDPNILFDLGNPNFQAKPASNPPSAIYVFGSKDTNSQTTYIRIWSGTAQQDGVKYTALPSYSNPAGTLNAVPVTIAYSFVRAVPVTTKITQYTETGTTFLDPQLPLSKKATFSSATDQIGNMTIEIGKSDWEITKNGGAPVQVTGLPGTGFILPDNLPGDVMSMNDKYIIKVKHYNLWGQAGPWSSTATYTVGATGDSGGGTYSINYKFLKPGTGINTIAIPFDPTAGNITDKSSTAITTVGELITSINTQMGADVVTVFGWYDEAKQQHVGLTSITSYTNHAVTGGVSYPTDTYATYDKILVLPIQKNRAYQISVNKDVSSTPYTLKGTAK
ncbi:MAG: hypothetical protein WC632_03990 [Candidatus Margulisiibacteriota bacterium]